MHGALLHQLKQSIFHIAASKETLAPTRSKWTLLAERAAGTEGAATSPHRPERARAGPLPAHPRRSPAFAPFCGLFSTRPKVTRMCLARSQVSSSWPGKPKGKRWSNLVFFQLLFLSL